MLSLNDHVNIGDVYAFLISAMDPGEIFVNLDDDDVSLLTDRTGHSCINREIKISVFVHG